MIVKVEDAEDLAALYSRLGSSQARVIVILCEAREGAHILRKTFEHGIGGDGFLWVGGTGLSQPDMWKIDDGVDGLMRNPTLRLRVFKGLVSVRPSAGEGTAAYDRYLARRRQLPSTEGDNSSCNLETDDDGNLLWCVLPRLERDRRCSRAGLPRHMLHRIRCFTAPWPPPLVGPRTTMTTLPRP